MEITAYPLNLSGGKFPFSSAKYDTKVWNIKKLKLYQVAVTK